MAIRLLKFYRLIFLKLLCKQLGYFLQVRLPETTTPQVALLSEKLILICTETWGRLPQVCDLGTTQADIVLLGKHIVH